MNNHLRKLFLISLGLLAFLAWHWADWKTNQVQADIDQIYELHFAQLADGGGYATQFLLVNPSDTDITCTIDLFHSSGTPLPLALNSYTDSSFTMGIKARGTLILRSGNQGTQTKTGWARVRSTNPIGGSLIYSYTVNGKIQGEAGLDPSVPAESFRLSLDMQNGYLAGLAVANPNPIPVSLSLTLYDSGGNPLAWSNRVLNALEHYAQLPAEIFPSYNFYNFTGSIVVRAPENVVIGTTLRFDAGVNVLASIPVIDPSSNPEAEILNFPQIADGAGYGTTFCLVNPNDHAISAQLDFFNQQGTPLAIALFGRSKAGSHPITLPAHGTAFLYTLNASANHTDIGWARVTADGPIGGSAIYLFQSGGRALSQAGINPAIAATEFVLPVDQTGGMLSGLAVANPSTNGSVTLFLTLFDNEGMQKGTTATRVLQERRQFALMLNQLFPEVNMSNFTGSVVVKAEGGKVAGTTLRFSGDLSVFASIPVISGIPVAAVPSSTTSTSTTSTTSSTTTSSTLAPLHQIQGSLDSPKNGATVSGVGGGSGWAVLISGKTGTLPTKVELMVDGTAAAIAQLGIARTDVRGYFATQGITVPDNTGYKFSWASFTYAAGSHTLAIRATDSVGQTYEIARIEVNLPAGNNNLHSTDSILGKLRAIPAGTFTQGSPNEEVGRVRTNEQQFLHTLTRNLLVMETEVTRQMWTDLRAVQVSLPSDPSYSTSSGTLPVEKVTWYEAVLFANLLSLQRGLQRVYYVDSTFSTPVTSTNYQTDAVYANWSANGYRLPAEGEWEYLTRAGTTTPFSIGEPAYNGSTSTTCDLGVLTALEGVAWFCANADKTTHPAGSKAGNPWGMKDVHGNVREWVWDWYLSYSATSQTDFRGPVTGTNRVYRGGDLNNTAQTMRSAFRGYQTPDRRSNLVGFRLVRLQP